MPSSLLTRGVFSVTCTVGGESPRIRSAKSTQIASPLAIHNIQLSFIPDLVLFCSRVIRTIGDDAIVDAGVRVPGTDTAPEDSVVISCCAELGGVMEEGADAVGLIGVIVTVESTGRPTLEEKFCTVPDTVGALVAAPERFVPVDAVLATMQKEKTGPHSDMRTTSPDRIRVGPLTGR